MGSAAAPGDAGEALVGQTSSSGVLLWFCCFVCDAVAILVFSVCDAVAVYVLYRHPRFAFVLQALPLCGAALTFFAAAKKVREGLNNPFSAWDL
ncbi:hypothetical protein [Paraburkholderia azotifigens]|uniref:Uncharacterized protein n=1 Tax=Paraburkholderia azotifigens TaxID=2057004 RepID=A0A5C6VMV5_9BURK|nr:hypothetical protein [Paraburkholderia azotifigens]TXC86537.1 hypothetical protein FRZ40_02480 [Paraburkholderia azotifigens]